MNCDEIREHMSPLLDGRLEADQAKAVRDHLADCETCRTYMSELEVTLKGLNRLGSQRAPAELKARVQARLKAAVQAEASPEAPVIRRSLWRRPVFLARVAAVLVVGLLIGMFWALQVGQNGGPREAARDARELEAHDVAAKSNEPAADPPLAMEGKAAGTRSEGPAPKAWKPSGVKQEKSLALGDRLADEAAPDTPAPTPKGDAAFGELKKMADADMAKGGYRAAKKSERSGDAPAELASRTPSGVKDALKGEADQAPAEKESERKQAIAAQRGGGEEQIAATAGGALPAAPRPVAAKPGIAAPQTTAVDAEERVLLAEAMDYAAGTKQTEAEAPGMDKADEMVLRELRIPVAHRDRTLRYIDGLLAAANTEGRRQKGARGRAAALEDERAPAEKAVAPAKVQAPAEPEGPREETVRDAGRPESVGKARVRRYIGAEANAREAEVAARPLRKKEKERPLAGAMMLARAEAREAGAVHEITLTRAQYQQLDAFVKALMIKRAPAAKTKAAIMADAKDAPEADVEEAKNMDDIVPDDQPAPADGRIQAPAFTVLRIRIIEENPAAE